MIFRNRRQKAIDRYLADADKIRDELDADIEAALARAQDRAIVIIKNAQNEANSVIREAQAMIEAAKAQITEAEKRA